MYVSEILTSTQTHAYSSDMHHPNRGIGWSTVWLEGRMMMVVGGGGTGTYACVCVSGGMHR